MGAVGSVASRPAWEGLGHEGLANAGTNPWSPWPWPSPLRNPLSLGRLHVSVQGLTLS